MMQPCGRVVGFIHFKRLDGTRMCIDLIAAHTDVQGKGIGGVLMRWEEAYAREARISSIELWGIDDHVPQYEGLGYAKIGDSMNLGGEGELYHHMQGRLLYNVKPEGLDVQAACD